MQSGMLFVSGKKYYYIKDKMCNVMLVSSKAIYYFIFNDNREYIGMFKSLKQARLELGE